MHLWRSSSNVPRLPSFLEMRRNPHVLLTFDKVHNPLRLPREATSERSKVFRTPQFFGTFDFEMCFAPQRSALFRHLNLQKWSDTEVFVHFHFEMCFAPQRSALFRHLNCQKWSAPRVFCTFWLRNVLRATTACTFSTSQLPKWSAPRVFCTFWLRNVLRATTACIFRHLNFQTCSETQVFCTFWLANVLRATTACNFSSLIWPAGSAPAALASLLFDPPEPQIIWKTQCFSHLHLLSSYSFSSTLLSSNLSLLSASSLLCFSSVHIVGSLTSKLPSIIIIVIGVKTNLAIQGGHFVPIIFIYLEGINKSESSCQAGKEQKYGIRLNGMRWRCA